MRLLPLLVVAALLVGCDTNEEARPAPAPAPEPPPPAITSAELDEHLAALQRIADAHGGNRAAGTEGYRASADYVAARLREAGWRVRRDPVRFPYFDLHSASLRVDGRPLRRERDFQVLTYSGSGRVDGRLRPSGDGCSASDLAGLTPADIPVVDRGGCFFRVKALAAQRAGARAVVVSADTASRRGIYSGTLAGPGTRIPVVLASTRAVGAAGAGTAVRVSVDADSGRRTTTNVIAETPRGAAESVVMAGGHLDSVPGGPGVNDNVSGVATLIELAEAIGTKPRGARVRVAFWGAEELGLLGSRQYVRSLSRVERQSIRAYVNFDMVGSPNAVPALYADGDRSLARVLRRSTGARLRGVTAGGGSDHAPFRAVGIAVNGLYTGGPEPGRGGRPRDPCYHLSCDTAKNVDRDTLLAMARAAARALEAIAARRK